MFNLICITNRKLCKNDFLTQIELIAKAKPTAIILREKDLSEDEYEKIAKSVIEICEKYETKCILHNFYDVAIKLDCKNIHLPLFVLENMPKEKREFFDVLGASCHSKEDAVLAKNLGCSYITAGHVFETDCKKGLKGRGVEFLKDVCKSVNIPVYALGGIEPSKTLVLKNAGAKGCAIMSSAMNSENPKEFFELFKEKENEF